MTAVIRCPACQGLSKVGFSSLNQLVICPRCHGPFVAEEHERAEVLEVEEVPSPPPAVEAEPAEHILAPAGLSHSVLFGLALLPFIIPLLWIAIPILTGWEPNVSIAIPIAMALAAAALSLAVVSTVDWSPSTRVKGVLMIVGLAYFSAVTLFFLKRDAIEWIKEHLASTALWHQFHPPGREFSVKVPDDLVEVPNDEPVPGWKLKSFRSEEEDPGHRLAYMVAFGPWDLQQGLKPDDWLDTAIERMSAASGNAIFDLPRESPYLGNPGRESTFVLNKRTGLLRVVRICHIGNKLYVMAVEGKNISSDKLEVRTFFDSFQLTGER